LRSGLPAWRVELSADRDGPKLLGTKLAGLKVSPESVRFQASDASLPYPLPPLKWRRGVLTNDRTLRVENLRPGRYGLRIDGKAVDVLTNDGRMVSAPTAEDLARGVAFYRTPERDQAEALRKVINEKNELYFYRWRPQNETYLLGFRKYEQGNNARE